MVNFKGFFFFKNQSIRRKFSSENKSLRFLYKVHFILHSALQKKKDFCIFNPMMMIFMMI